MFSKWFLSLRDFFLSPYNSSIQLEREWNFDMKNLNVTYGFDLSLKSSVLPLRKFLLSSDFIPYAICALGSMLVAAARTKKTNRKCIVVEKRWGGGGGGGKGCCSSLLFPLFIIGSLNTPLFASIKLFFLLQNKALWSWPMKSISSRSYNF